MSCRGTCGRTETLDGHRLPRTGTLGVAALGAADCPEPFDHTRAGDPRHLEQTGCVSIADQIPPP